VVMMRLLKYIEKVVWRVRMLGQTSKAVVLGQTSKAVVLGQKLKDGVLGQKIKDIVRVE